MPVNYKLYHPKWKLISRLIRFKRAGGRCELCGAEHLKPHPISGRRTSLATAHLDGDRNNNRFSNLAALCQKCHIRNDITQQLWGRKYGKETAYKNGKLF